MFFIGPIKNFYGRFERPISSGSLILGFIFDAFTLKRVDTLFENIWILAHLVIVAVFIILIHTEKSEVNDEKNPSKKHFWYVNILQFFFGGLFSTYLVLYFKSADFFSTWPFILLLAVAFIANESMKRHYIQLSFQIGLFFLSIYSFTIFLVPVVLHKISAWIFLFSGLVSLALILLFIRILFHFIKDPLDQPERGLPSLKTRIFYLISGIFILFNFLYFTNLIPPIPLSLKDAGVYHSVGKNRFGNYVATYENQGWLRYFKLYPNFKITTGQPVYVFSAVFSPSDFNITVVHEWQHYDETKDKWITESMINLPLVGGRDEGFRTYSARKNLESGKWKVKVKTKSNQVIGQTRFNIVPVETEAILKTMEL
ncbi:MAG: DUF2914 domain-containing protein [Candidatus Parcubacteria bacterium]|nr:DUF2914 domain-containing protein [Candidatus Parcubacteria bacterium]